MSDLFDKAVLVGLGLEKKARETLEELQKRAAERKVAAGGAGGGQENLSAKETIENKVVEEGARALKEFLLVINVVKEKIEEEMVSSSGKVLEKLHVPTADDVEVIKEMARVAREKVDRLEKRVEELEARLGQKNG